MSLPARRARQAVVHSGAMTGLAAIVIVVFGVASWVADLIVVGVVAIVVTVVVAYVLSHPDC
jgi:hypothetical protein